MRHVLRLWLALVVFVPIGATAQNADTGLAICHQAEAAINLLVDYTNTACIPTKGNAKGTMTFLLVSTAPVFSVEASKKAWILTAVGAVGKFLNDRPSFKADELWFSDVNNVKQHVAYVMPASLARNLSIKVRADKIDLEQMYAEIQRSLTRRTVQQQ